MTLTATADLTTGLVACYPFDGNAEDTTGHHHGSATAVNYGAGVIGQAAYFDGIASEVNLDNLGTIEDYSVCLWFKKTVAAGYPAGPDWSGEADLFGTQASAGCSTSLKVGFHTAWKDSLAFHVMATDCTFVNAYTEKKATDTSWHHLVLTRQREIITIYLDGTASPCVLSELPAIFKP